MAVVCLDLDGTLVQPGLGGQSSPIEGAVEAVTRLANEGHKLTVFTARFTPMPEKNKQQMKEAIQQELASLGFPEMEIWTGTTKPPADIFIDDKAVTFDYDWPAALAQTYMMLDKQKEEAAQAQQGGDNGSA